MPAPAGRARVAPARRSAYTVLRRVFERGAYAQDALNAAAHGLDARDRALAMQLAYGAVQRRGTLDHLIERLAQRPPARIDAPLLAALRLGLYELLYLGGAPDYAVVADAVELAKQDARAGRGLVNAVLRRAAREGADALLGGLRDDTPEQAAIMHSHPLWIAQLFFEELGAEQARALLRADNEAGEVAIRANTLVTGAGELAAQLPVRTHGDPRLPEALVLEQPFDMHASPLWRSGALTAQSRAAMLVARALAPRPGERVLDLCAAPGGKATHLAALMEGQGEIVAVDRDSRRAEALAQNARRLAAGIVRVEVADASVRRSDGCFDRVLVDPPCSGLGTLQARPDLRWRVGRAGPPAIADMARRQLQILQAGARALRPNGVLVYSTCTISANENERVIDQFLESDPAYELEDLAGELDGLGLDGAAGTPAARAVQTLPHRDGTAGFFIARLRRRG
jgi:16S rRNA (cytosine967-C5)-methyltransferase